MLHSKLFRKAPKPNIPSRAHPGQNLSSQLLKLEENGRYTDYKKKDLCATTFFKIIQRNWRTRSIVLDIFRYCLALVPAAGGKKLRFYHQIHSEMVISEGFRFRITQNFLLITSQKNPPVHQQPQPTAENFQKFQPFFQQSQETAEKYQPNG